MRKYWAYYRLSVQDFMAYRGAISFWLLGNVLSVATMLFVWFSVDAGSSIAGYTKNELITYYIISIFLAWIVGWYPFWISKDIKSGDIVGKILLKPVSLYWLSFFSDFAWHTMSLSFGLVASMIMWFLLRDHFIFLFSVEKLILLPLASIISVFVVFGSVVVVCLSTFWLTETSIFNDIFWLLISVFGGETFPISFLPQSFGIVPKLLPFRYMFSFPMEIYFNKLSNVEVGIGFIIGSVWILIIGFLYKQMWSRGLKIYNPVGQ